MHPMSAARLAVTVAAGAALLALAPSFADATHVPLRRVAIEATAATEAAALAEQLAAAGFDVLHGQRPTTSVELVINEVEQQALLDLGLSPITLEVGRPLRDILADREAVPAGYLDGPEIVAELLRIEAAYPAIARVVDLTDEYGMPATAEGRHLHALKISDNVQVREDEHAFLMVSAHHCREIVTPVIALDAIDRLVTGYGIDPALTAIVDGYELWIAPLWNPDGYNTVFTTDNLWRKNRRVFGSTIGVDLNRNYDMGWADSCGGSTNPNSSTYRGPAAASEVETQTLMAWTDDQKFAVVLDFHSSGREVLYSYKFAPGTPCAVHPWQVHQGVKADLLTRASGYTDSRAPSAHGEHYEWQLLRGAEAFLTETHTEFQPSYTSAMNEAARVWPGTVWLLQNPVALTGHVRDACDGTPLVADIEFPDTNFTEGEQHASFLPFGRYHAFPPPGLHRVQYAAPGYDTVEQLVGIVDGVSAVLEIELTPTGGCPPACATAALVEATDLLCVKQLPATVWCTWTGDPNAVEHHLNAVTDKTLLADPRRSPGFASAECDAPMPSVTCTDDDGLTTAEPRLFYNVLAACGPDGIDEGPF